jgi:Sulfotransferase family
VPAGWVTGPPHFVGVGAQRAGTKWWYRMISDHPAVEPAPGKELHFFDDYADRPFTDDDVLAYHRMLPRPEGLVTGEWTPRYMVDFWTPAMLRRAAPDARVLVLLRDPWARYRSGLAHEMRVFRRELPGPRGAGLAATIADQSLTRSLYAPQIARLLDAFDRAHLLILQYERCVADPEGELRRTYEFLGLEPATHVPVSLRERVGRSSQAPDSDTELPPAAARAIARDAAELAELAPEVELDRWPSVSAASG